MTVSSSTSRNSYNGNGTTDTFAYTFRILDETHVAVYEDGVLKTITTHYTVTGVGDASGGNIVFVTPPVTGTLNVVFVRNVPITQETDYVENDPFPAASHEDALDKLTMIVQQQEEKFDRIPTLAVSSATSDLVFPDPSADKYLGWNSAGDELENKTLATVDAISLPVSIANGGTGQITAAAGLSALGGLPLAGGTMTGLLNLAAGADIASAATIDLTAATGNTVRITGTAGTSALTMNAGQWMMLIADGAWVLTYHATTFKLNTGGANYTCAAGDRVLAAKDDDGIIQASIIKENGTAIASASVAYYANQVLQEVYPTDAGSTTTSATLANVTGGAKQITPKSSSSTIIVECMFDGKIAAAGAGLNSNAKFRLYDYGNSVDIGQKYTLGVASEAGINAQTDAPCNLAAYVANSALDARSFTLRARYGLSSAQVTAVNHVWRIREVKN